MIELLRYDDDPPIFAVSVTGQDAGRQLDTWLRTERNRFSRRVTPRLLVHLEGDAEMTAGEVEALQSRHDVSIEVRERGFGSTTATT